MYKLLQKLLIIINKVNNIIFLLSFFQHW